MRGEGGEEDREERGRHAISLNLPISVYFSIFLLKLYIIKGSRPDHNSQLGSQAVGRRAEPGRTTSRDVSARHRIYIFIHI